MFDLKISFKKQQFDVREEAILNAVNALLSEKGFDLMTMDDVAAAVGIAKGSLYKHFSSKERLAAAVMVRLLTQTDDVLDNLDAAQPALTAVAKLEGVLRWSLMHRLEGNVPHLPSTSKTLQRAMVLNLPYLAVALPLNRRFYRLVAQARADGALNAAVPDDVVVYSLYSRACDPTVEFLRRDAKMDNASITEAMVAATFGGFKAAVQHT